ncbi:S-layer homology domain-containing protein [Paenibacillus alba]|uniref:S-layer homology domain-containing protein n=1 Tax=Paenibacillus alba TaxID=1197127 RepID=A0ABU6FYW6_9BACL|nr:S-layer homology domain-containing protein [Paenibacillus alba]MEC0227077.1 S-layer homology domain-containing protein [Paenibacillus alba]
MQSKLKIMLLFMVLSLMLMPAVNAVSVVESYITDNQERTITTLTLGQEVNLRMRIMLSDNTSSIAPNPIFSSSNTGIGSVSSQGVFSTLSLGTTVLTATYGGVTKTLNVQVNPPYHLKFDQYQYALNQGEKRSFTLTGQAYFGDDLDYSSRVTYSSSAPDIVQVDKSGIKALKSGSAIISASFGSVTAMSTVNVVNAAVVSGTDDPQAIPQRSSGYMLWNNIRTAMGSSPLTENQLLTRAAQNHANYLHGTGSSQAASSRGHVELPGEVGFTGQSIADRLTYVGYKISGYGEVVNYVDNTNNSGIQGLIDAPYHRSLMLDPTAIEFGIGIASSAPKITVSNIGYKASSNTPTAYYYPYSGQTNVPTSWYAAETPNPLAPFGKEGALVGYPITISATEFKNVNFSSATITDSSGNNTDYYKTDASNSSKGIVVLTPKTPLNPSTTYTVHFEGSLTSGTTIQKEWTFTTRSETISSITASPSKLSLQVGKSQSLRVWAVSDVNGNQEVTSQAQYQSSDSHISVQNGTVTASGTVSNVTITITYRGASTTVSLSAIDPENPNLKQAQDVNGDGISSTEIPSDYRTISRQMKDLSGHWAEKEIAWAISQNLVQGYEDKTFQPNRDVTEAEFIAFALRALKTDKTGLDLQQNNHWADGLYVISKKYNLPLLGYSNQSARETKLTRTRVAEIIAAIDGQSLTGDDAIAYLLNRHYSDGKTSATIEGYQGGDTLTRAETIKFLLNVLQKGATEVKKS